ncbi:hypothetical protein, partial [Nocardioides stalactiti]|uniref:hypothetical protein n=1 Tax=Nocardioides stalactiti TaxID=2755356 RepID=UPI0015FF63EA
ATVGTDAGLEAADGRAKLRLEHDGTVKRVSGAVVDGLSTIVLPRLDRGRWDVRITYVRDDFYRRGRGDGSVRVRR